MKLNRQDGKGQKTQCPKQISKRMQLFDNCIDKQRNNYDSNNEEEWLTSKEAAQYLKVSVKSLMNLTSQGKIPYYKLGGRNRYYKHDLKSMLFGNARGGF